MRTLPERLITVGGCRCVSWVLESHKEHFASDSETTTEAGRLQYLNDYFASAASVRFARTRLGLK